MVEQQKFPSLSEMERTLIGRDRIEAEIDRAVDALIEMREKEDDDG